MTTPLLAVLGFALWTLTLVAVVASWRVIRVLRGEVPANGFASGEKHGSDRYWRLNRAHANCVENLPIFAAIVLSGAVANAEAPILATLAMVVLTARVLQTATHISSGTAMAVNARFAFFATQVVCMFWMAAVTASALV